MKRIVLLLALAVGCDSPAAASRASNILEHGLVQAELDCNVQDDLRFAPPDSCPAGSALVFKLDYLQDGSAFIQRSLSSVPVSHFVPRGNPFGPMPNGPFFITFPGDGSMEITSPGVLCSGLVYSKSIEIEGNCTGFNLAAFGVE